MANDKLVTLLKQGIEVWSAWREKNPDVVLDLRGANLSDMVLAIRDLRNANLSSATLDNTMLSGANLCRANLRGASLRGANLWRADLSDADLSGVDLSEVVFDRTFFAALRLGIANFLDDDLDIPNTNFRSAILRGANLRGKNLRCVTLGGADLSGADLSGTDLGGTDLSGTDLSNALLSKANLAESNLYGANLRDADFRQATLIDSRLDGAILTGAKFWETQHGGWSIKGITCRRILWDRNGEEATEYEDGAFEQIFAEKKRIMFHYPGGMSPVDLAMLPIIVKRLQAEHPGCALHIRSVQDDGGSGATVTITVEDLADRSDEAFAQDVEVLHDDFATLQQRLQQEERLRLEFEAKYSAMVRDIVPVLLEKPQRKTEVWKTEVHVGHITAPMTIGSTSMSNKTFNVHGQAGAVGDNAHAHNMTFQQVQNQGPLDLPRLADELKRLRTSMKEANDKDDQDEAIGAVAAAEKAAVKGDGQTALQHLKTAGTWALGIAEKIGVSVAAEAIKRAM